ncbi:MAG TPA: carboxylesterase [Aquabacterium sp.]|nr:carboxylesterase [Aquabacterium sp.]
MTLTTLELQNGPQPQASLIILHGLGADGEDFIPVCRALQLPDVGDLRFVLPSAPEMPVSVNGGYVMRAWYDIRPPGQLPREDEAGLRLAQTWIDELIEREIDRGIPAHRIVLMGFSQGCAMALMTGLRCRHRLGALVGLSGYLPLLETTATERHPTNQSTPIFLAHGDQDDVVPMARGIQSRNHLLSLGYPVTWQDYPIDHTLCLEEVDDLSRWLNQHLASI